MGVVKNSATGDVDISDTGSTSDRTVGFRGTPMNTRTGGTGYTLTLSDNGKVIYKGDNTAQTWTVPANATVAFPIGTTILLDNTNGGSTTATTVTIAKGASVIIVRGDGVGTLGADPATRTLARGNSATLRKVATNTWIITGSTGLSS
jgi:hypothetical protein